jgi:hypothetical protein
VSELNRAGQLNSLGHLDTTQKDFRSQIDAITDTVRQLGGKPFVGQGGQGSDPLTAPYVLYVDSYTGSDKFVGGDYNKEDTGTFESKMRRISLQRLECGYTVARPFKSISRAVIEAGIITSRDYLDLTPAPCGDLVTIVVSSGVHTLLNDPGYMSGVSEWVDGYTPDDAALTAFSGSKGGVILPRGASIVSLDLRKTIIRPNYVPPNENEAADLSNRSSCFLLTGGCYAYGFTLMDKLGLNRSHHLLSAFAFAGEDELDTFYAKIRKAFAGSGATGNIDAALAVPRSSEYLITGPQPPTPSEPTDTVRSSSPYIYNISLRSEYGMAGILCDGNLAGASFKSMVVSQFTGVSLQKDISCWQKYTKGTASWGPIADYPELIDTSPNDLRMNPSRRSIHVRTCNGAVVQEVSVFAIGQQIHHLAESGSQITITNSNSNWGGCAALAVGFQKKAAPGDTPWEIKSLRRALSPFEKSGNVNRIFLGTLTSTQLNEATTLELIEDLDPSSSDLSQPAVLSSQSYSLKEDEYIWVENPGGPDYRAKLAANPWQAANGDEIEIKTRVETDNATGNVNPSNTGLDPNTYNDIAGKRVYVRRIRDVRSVEERRYSLIVSGGTNPVRLPVRDYVIQPTAGDDWDAQLQAVAASETSNKYLNGANVELRYSKRVAGDTNFAEGTYYRKGDVIRKDNKHLVAVKPSYGPFEEESWVETYVHMQGTYAPEGYYTNAQPVIIFDRDTDESSTSSTLGNKPDNNLIRAQEWHAVDAQGMAGLLLNYGYDRATVRTLIESQLEENRNLDVSINNWEVEFRRPTNIRLYSHAYEWAGGGNYTKGLPQYQKELTPNNKFTFYFTNEAGGKVYASGFNEEGLQVTPRGLEDLTTGQVLTVSEIGAPDRTIDFPTVFADLEVTNQLTVNGILVEGAAKTDAFGFVELAGLSELDNPTPAVSNADIENQPNAVTPEGLAYWKESQKLVQALPNGIPYALLHVAAGTPLTGADSVPYGTEVDPGVEWSADGNVFHQSIFKTLTEAVEKASQLFLPTGSTVVISIHDDLVENEDGPIQLVNGYARFLVAGARGATNPRVHMKWGTTANACARIPQYRGVRAYSAGAVFADLTLDLDNNGRTSISATFNGGLACGGRDVILNWSNVASYSNACTCSYGGQINLDFYGTELHYITNNIVSQDVGFTELPRLTLLGSDRRDSGLTGHGCNLIVDFKEDDTPAGFRFSHSLGNQPQLLLLDLGKRGGVKTGGRVLPKVDFDFSNDLWDLTEIVGYNYLHNPNLIGKTFRSRELTGSASSTFNISAASLATVKAAELRNGNQVDIERRSSIEPIESGFFSLLVELENDPSISGLLLTAENTTNAYVYFPPATAAPSDLARNT